MADVRGVKSDGARPLAAATLSEEEKTEEDSGLEYKFNCGCNGRPAELAGREGGLEGGFENET